MTRSTSRFRPLNCPTRTWPDHLIERAPTWCSVDLRDGNQALAVPMSVEEKLEYFDMLVKIGFKEIEIGFPSASQIEFDFTRRLIEENRIPGDVWVQMLVQCEGGVDRADVRVDRGLRRGRSCISITRRRRRSAGSRSAWSKQGVVDIAARGTEQIRALADEYEVPGTQIRFEYSPESFSGDGGGFCAGDLRGGRRGVETDGGRPDHFQPALEHGGDDRCRITTRT